MKILLAVDGSVYTQKMLDYLTQQQPLISGAHHYTVITVQPPLPARARAALGKDTVEQYHAEEAQKITGPAVDFLAQHGITATVISKVGPVAETIAQEADHGGYALLAMGSHGHGALGKLVMGSVSTQVMAESTIPVLLIR